MLQLDCYEVLGISHNASNEEIRRAYHRLVLQFHPDINPGVPESEQRLREIIQAYERLKDPVSRLHYDQRQKVDAIVWEFGSWERSNKRIYSPPRFSFRPFIYGSILAATIFCAGLAFCRGVSAPIEWQEWKPICLEARSTVFDSNLIDPRNQWALEFWQQELEMSPTNNFAACNLAQAYEGIAKSAQCRGDRSLAHQYRLAAAQVRPPLVCKRVRSRNLRRS